MSYHDIIRQMITNFYTFRTNLFPLVDSSPEKGGMYKIGFLSSFEFMWKICGVYSKDITQYGKKADFRSGESQRGNIYFVNSQK